MNVKNDVESRWHTRNKKWWKQPLRSDHVFTKQGTTEHMATYFGQVPNYVTF